jgi:hypothetical protein
MPTLLLPPPPILPSAEIAFAARGQRWQVETLSGPPALDRLRDRADVAPYGDWPVVTHLANLLHLALLAPTVDWLPRLPEAYRRRPVRLLPAGEARRLAEPILLRPVLSREDAPASAADTLLEAASLVPEEPVLASEPVSWETEFRCFVRERSPAALALYARNGKVLRAPGCEPVSDVEQQEAEEFVKGLLNDPAVALPPALVVDIGRIAGRGWAVAAAGPAWCRLRYFCHPHGVLNTLQRACGSAFRLTEAERPWVAVDGPWAGAG